MGNSVAFLEMLFAVAKLGAITVPVNFRLSADEIAYILEDSRAAVLVHDARWAELAKAALAATKAPVEAVVDASGSGPLSMDGLAESVPIAAPGAGVRPRRRRDHVHLRDDRAPQGRDAYARQPDH